MIAYGFEKTKAGVAGRVEIPTRVEVHSDEHGKIPRAHAAIRIQQRAVIRAFLLAHGRFVEETANAFLVPDLINNFGFVGSHVVPMFCACSGGAPIIPAEILPCMRPPI